MRCEWEPAGAFQWSLIKKEALGYLQAAGEETARMKVRQVPDSAPRWITAHFHPSLVAQSAFLSSPLCSQPDNGHSSLCFAGTKPQCSHLGSGVFSCKSNTHCALTIHLQFIYTIPCLSTCFFSMQFQISKCAGGIQLKTSNNLQVHYFSPTIFITGESGCRHRALNTLPHSFPLRSPADTSIFLAC